MGNICALSDAAIFAGIGTIGIIVLMFGAALLVFSALVSIYQWVVIYRTRKANRQKINCGLTGEQVAKSILENLGYKDTKVEKAGFWKGLLFGNHYNVKKDTVYIKKFLSDKATLASVTVAAQKAAEVEAHKNGDKKIAKRSRIQRSGILAPIVFVPLVLIGVALDFVFFKQMQLWTIIFTVLALAYFIYGLVGMGLTIKIEKASAAKAVEYFEKTNLLTENELQDAKKLYKTLITSYIINYIYMLLQIIRLIFKILGLILRASAKK